MYEQIKKDLETIAFQPNEFFEMLSENEKKEFLADCSLLFNNKCFKKICDELGTQAILYSVKETKTLDELAYGRGKIHGIAELYETLLGYNSMYLESIKKESDFDRHATI